MINGGLLLTFRKLISLAGIATLAACGSQTADPTNTGFATPSSAGTLSVLDSVTRDGDVTSPITGNTYAFQVGSIEGRGLQGFAGIAPGATVQEATGSEVATLNGTFQVGVIDSVNTSGSLVSGTATSDIGGISLTADFGAGTLTGSGSGINPSLNGNTLEIDGTINGDKLSGSATYMGVTGPLDGLVGTDEAIGVFHGHTDNQLHAGGFIAN